MSAPDARAPIPAATWRLTVLLVLVGAFLLSTGLGGGSPLGTAVFVGAMMFVWTTLLPRLGVLRPLGAFFASHALAAGAWWAALTIAERWTMVLGPRAEAVSDLRRLLVVALAAGALALIAGLALDRAVKRGGEKIRGELTFLLGVAVVLAGVTVGRAIGDAPRPIERIRQAPIVAHMARGQRIARSPLAVLRAADGSFAPVPSTNLDVLIAQGPAGVASFRGSANLCDEIGADEPIEVRQLGQLIIYTPEHALDDADAWVVDGCAYAASPLRRVAILTPDVPHPVATTPRITSVVLGALAVALIQLFIAGVALTRHARLAGAREAIADGAGWAELSDGTRAKCDGPSGPVLVALGTPRGGAYRDPAASIATVIGRGSRGEADAAMHEVTCVALIGAIAALFAVILPLAAAIAADLVVPL
jgi:hypothetical protein